MFKSLLKKEPRPKSFGDLFFALWIIAILIFLVLLVYFTNQPNPSEILGYFIGIVFLSGVGFFVLAIISNFNEIIKRRSQRQKESKDKLKSSKLLLYILLPIFVFCIVFLAIYNINKSKNSEIMRLENELKKLKTENDSQDIILEPTQQQFTEQSGEPSIQYQVQDSDPVITCLNDKCGNREMRRSLCDSYTCCQIGNEWKWIESQALCYQMQKDYREMKEKQEQEAEEQQKLLDEAKRSVDSFIKYQECIDDKEDEYDECLERCESFWGEEYSRYLSDCQMDCIESKVKAQKDYCGLFRE